MKNSITFLLIFAPAFGFSQSQQLKITNLEKQKTSFIKKGDKVLMGFKMARHQLDKKPSDVYSLTKSELVDSALVVTKGRILSINDSVVLVRERNSFFSATNREIRIDKINALKKLSTGNQLFRTAATVTGGLALGIMMFYSYAAVGGGEGFVSGMFEAAGAGLVLTRFGRTQLAKKHVDNWKTAVVVR